MDRITQPAKKISWKEVSKMFPAVQRDSDRARALFISYEKKGYLENSDLSLDNCSFEMIIDFFYRLSLIRSSESPVQRKKKPTWIHEKDFAYLNHRSIPFLNDHPFFAQLAIFPSIRANAIVLSPFTSNRKKELNTVDSHSQISSEFDSPILSEKGISVDQQFHLLIEAFHLLGKCVGYSLDYKVDRFSVPVLRRPDLFRWINTSLKISYKDMLLESNQKIIIESVNAIVSNYIKMINREPIDEDYKAMRRELMQSGYWTIPSCNDNSDQLPYYEAIENSPFPQFHGGDNNLTSFKFFYTDNPLESLRPDRHVNQAAFEYYSYLYIKWCDNFSFDFIKFHGIEYADDEKMRKADCPSMDMIRKVIKKTLSRISHTGIIGSLCSDPEHLLSLGFNTVFYHDSSFLIDRSFMERNYNLYTYLQEINRKKRKQLSIILHGGDNSPSPGHLENNNCRRIFISRFISCNRSYRPKYELWDDVLRKKNLADFPIYHMIENIFTRYGEIIHKGEIVKHYADEKVAWWIVRYNSCLLIPLVSLDNNDELETGPVLIDYSEIIASRKVLSVVEYDFTSMSGNLFLCGDEKIFCDGLDYKKFLLFSVQ